MRQFLQIELRHRKNHARNIKIVSLYLTTITIDKILSCNLTRITPVVKKFEHDDVLVWVHTFEKYMSHT